MPAWALYAAIGGLLLFVILLILILMLLGKRKKKKAAAEAAAAEAAAAAAMPTAEELLQAVQSGQAEPTGADVMSLQSEHSMELRKSLRKFVDENPEFAAQMLKIWLRGGDGNG
jgi:flagellar M-ring protein FliF